MGKGATHSLEKGEIREVASMQEKVQESMKRRQCVQTCKRGRI
jgi:hypothetical protein